MLTVNAGAFATPTFGAGFGIPIVLELFAGTSAVPPPQANKTAIRAIAEVNPINLGRIRFISFFAPIELNGQRFPAAIHCPWHYRWEFSS